ncbi:hypothetical protein HNQ91_001204 [Filimonas zeae]|uniref:Beta-lactamase-inhibitor-like PepSY-like domain-containing protein n=1 Tax=Filimonas zeae TaxID=1737353 RepID=A0A917ISH7_9BACT|nr:hypothetical protein [Filimonas zeae]MDR6338182.1 hypothetical protein [Filimonas zeae]GGH62121.1 hypothetical protein GCM10011379_11780 [Filimonas zeae]
MKKLLIAAVLTIVVAATASAGSFVENAKLEALFKAAYPGATHVHYKTVGDLISVSFMLDHHAMQAFYDIEGEKVAVSKAILFSTLPMRGQEAIKTRYAGYTATEAIEMDSQMEGVCYYISLKNDTRKIVVRLSPNGDLELFKRIKP